MIVTTIPMAIGFAAIVTVHIVASGQQSPPHDSRTRPPQSFDCQPNALTSYSGVVVDYRRETGRTRLRIRTDWESSERVTIRHPGSDDPSPWFRYAGGIFADSDWGRIESGHGRLRAGTRATAWVCADGRTVVDWHAPKE